MVGSNARIPRDHSQIAWKASLSGKKNTGQCYFTPFASSLWVREDTRQAAFASSLDAPERNVA
jgi:hypothetical protein